MTVRWVIARSDVSRPGRATAGTATVPDDRRTPILHFLILLLLFLFLQLLTQDGVTIDCNHLKMEYDYKRPDSSS